MATVIKQQVKTLKYLNATNNVLFDSKIKDLRDTLEAETNSLTKELYHGLLSLPKYLVKVEALYSNLKEVYNEH